MYTFLKIVFIEGVELCMPIKKLHTSNVQNYVNSLSNGVHQMYKIFNIFWKIVYIDCAEIWLFFEKLCTSNVQLCTSNVQNYVNSLSNSICWMCAIFNILWKKIVW